MKEIEKEGVIINQKDHSGIYDWLSENVKDYKFIEQCFTLTSGGKINAYCNVYLKEHITEIKYPFGHVYGCFELDGCYKLKSLKNCPNYVDESFECRCISLKSLKGCPTFVGIDFKCVGCYNLTSLINSPEEVGRDFYCSECHKLKSLNGCPKIIGRDMKISNFKNLVSLQGSTQELRGFTCINCWEITSFIGGPKKVKEVFYCAGCSKIVSLIGLPKFGENCSPTFKYNVYFSTDISEKNDYKLYLAMWLEFLESMSNRERLEYVNNFKYKGNRNKPIIPIEIMKEYGF